MAILDLAGFEVVIIVLLSVAVIYLLFKKRESDIRFEQRLKDHMEENEKDIRKDAINRSARTLSGKMLERLVPFLEKFKHDPHDVRWLGDPVDLVVFDGYSRNGRKDVDKITFVEVKSGESTLHPGQKSIRDAVKKKNIEWEEFRI